MEKFPWRASKSYDSEQRVLSSKNKSKEALWRDTEVVLIELTVPWEERAEEVHGRKFKKYQALILKSQQNGWKAGGDSLGHCYIDLAYWPWKGWLGSGCLPRYSSRQRRHHGGSGFRRGCGGRVDPLKDHILIELGGFWELPVWPPANATLLMSSVGTGSLRKAETEGAMLLAHRMAQEQAPAKVGQLR